MPSIRPTAFDGAMASVRSTAFVRALASVRSMASVRAALLMALALVAASTSAQPKSAGTVVSSWTGQSDQAWAEYGSSAAGTGDVNGDGYADIVAGAPLFDVGTMQDAGKAYLYLGTPAGPALLSSWVGFPDQARAHYGNALAGAGDVNGDGYDDVIVGAWSYSHLAAEEGKAYVYFGSRNGLSLAPSWSVLGGQTGACLGQSVASAGDVNGDGYDDVLVGAHLYDGTRRDAGKVFLFFGSAHGPALSPSWTAEGDQDDSRFGWSVAGAGDVNGDGYDDFLVGAPGRSGAHLREGRTLLYLGSPSGPLPGPSWVLDGEQQEESCGYSLGSGDVNGDGFSDLLVGSPFYDDPEGDEGRVRLFLGSPGGPAAEAAWTVESNQYGAWLGYAIAANGDVNRDGYADILVGAPLSTSGHSNEGRALLFAGSALGVQADEIWLADGGQTGAAFGGAVAFAGDTDGDGRSDLLVGALGYDDGEENEGAAFVYLEGDAPSGVLDLPDASGDPGRSGPGEPALRFPNPYRPGEAITFRARAAGAASVSVYDMSGRLLSVLNADALGGGLRSGGITRWNGRDALGRAVAPGVYLLQVEYGGRGIGRKVVLEAR